MEEIIMNHTIIVVNTLHSKSFLITCSCGNLCMDVVEEDVGRLIRIHWDVSKRKEGMICDR